MRFVIRSGQLVTRIRALVPYLFTDSADATRLDGASAKRVCSSQPVARGTPPTCDGESRLNRSIQEAK